MVGCEARASKHRDAVDEYYCRQNDVCMLRLFEAFLESAPQLTLQLYIVVATNDAASLTGEKLVGTKNSKQALLSMEAFSV